MNPVLLRKQLKDNAADLQDFCDDLKSWGQEMKHKEDGLKVDTCKEPKVPATGSKHKVPGSKSVNKIGSTDYAKWDKFDADLECERLEDDLKDDSELSDEFEQSSRDEAMRQKDLGNVYVKSQEWEKAIECYTNAIGSYSYDPVYYANRALCYLKQNKFSLAEEDCTLSLRLDGTYVKAFQRRAAAREALEKYEDAKLDLEKVIEHEPKNREALSMLGRIKPKLQTSEKLPESENRPTSKFSASRPKTQPMVSHPFKPSATPVDRSIPSSTWPDVGSEIVIVKPIVKPPHLRSKKPLRRITITESNKNLVEDIQPSVEAVKKHVVEQIPKDLGGAGEPVQKISAFRQSRNNAKNNDETNRPIWPVSTGHPLKSDDLKVCERVEIKEKEEKNTENITKAKIKESDIGNQLMNLVEPKTSVQFYTTWKTLKTLENKFEYLKLIKPDELPNIFRESMESKIFSTILEILSSYYLRYDDIDVVYKFLVKLTEVKRFPALVLFMDSTDKNHVWKVISYLREQKQVNKEDLDNLIADYEL